MLDSLGSHKGLAVRRAIRAAGVHLLFLPPYSADLNLVERWSSPTLLRKASKRFIAAVWKCIGSLLNQFSPNECAHYIKYARYDQN